MSSKSRVVAKLRGGSRYRRIGGSMTHFGKRSPVAIPQGAARTMGHCFPREPATKKQIQALRARAIEYVRDAIARRFDDAPVEFIGECLGLRERQAMTVVGRLRNRSGSAEANLVIDILHGMQTGKIAGVLGTTHDSFTRWLFSVIRNFDGDTYWDELPEAARPDDLSLLRMLHFSFCEDYREWDTREK